MASIKPLGVNGKVIAEQFTKEYFLKSIIEAREIWGKSVEDFDFNKSRCRLLSKCEEIEKKAERVVYWMSRDCRVQDNWALLFAQRLALKYELPLHVLFFYKDTLDLYPTIRQFKFLIEGLKEVNEECKQLNIDFRLVNSTPLELPKILKDNNIGCLVTDFSPLRKIRQYKEDILKEIPEDISVVEVDAHNVVPVWLASDKEEIAARTIRSKIMKKLPEYLTGYPCVAVHQHSSETELQLDNAVEDFDKVLNDYKSDITAEEVQWAKGGTSEGLDMLRTFITDRLQYYEEHRNEPSRDCLSNLSPWLHFGNISAARCALEVRDLKSLKTASFLEELIVRKELADNYCYYNSNYDNFEGAPEWARKTLNAHRNDNRDYIYTDDLLKNGETHDSFWNCAQKQLMVDGKIHSYMRMYWCKKILEWTASPEQAITTALWLNDSFSLDGSDPNGFVGVMWSICGVHDHAWKERNIFGKIRYMVDYSLQKKFDMESYCRKYNIEICTHQMRKKRKTN